MKYFRDIIRKLLFFDDQYAQQIQRCKVKILFLSQHHFNISFFFVSVRFVHDKFHYEKIDEYSALSKKTKVNNTVFLKIESVIISNLAESRKPGSAGARK